MRILPVSIFCRQTIYQGEICSERSDYIFRFVNP